MCSAVSKRAGAARPRRSATADEQVRRQLVQSRTGLAGRPLGLGRAYYAAQAVKRGVSIGLKPIEQTLTVNDASVGVFTAGDELCLLGTAERLMAGLDDADRCKGGYPQGKKGGGRQRGVPEAAARPDTATTLVSAAMSPIRWRRSGPVRIMLTSPDRYQSGNESMMRSTDRTAIAFEVGR